MPYTGRRALDKTKARPVPIRLAPTGATTIGDVGAGSARALKTMEGEAQPEYRQDIYSR